MQSSSPTPHTQIRFLNKDLLVCVLHGIIIESPLQYHHKFKMECLSYIHFVVSRRSFFLPHRSASLMFKNGTLHLFSLYGCLKLCCL